MNSCDIMTIFFIILISSINSSLNEVTLNKEPLNIKETYNYLRQLAYTCATTSYSKSQIQDECSYGPSSYDRILAYNSFSSYISGHDYHTNGLNYVTSLLVDSETHNFGNFMNDGAGMIILLNPLEEYFLLNRRFHQNLYQFHLLKEWQF